MVTLHYRLWRRLIIVPAMIENSGRKVNLDMVLDTGCASTLVVPRIFDDLDVEISDIGRKTTIHSALGSEEGRLFRVKRFEIFGRSFVNQILDCHALPEYFQIDGLIGMDVLNQFSFKVDPRKKLITTDIVY